MVTSEDLENIGFEYPENGLPFFGKNHWIFEGSKHHMYNSTSGDEVLIFFDADSETCKYIGSEFCIIHRLCLDKIQVEGFVNSIKFLFCLY